MDDDEEVGSWNHRRVRRMRECERCGRDALAEHIERVELQSDYSLCTGCIEDLDQSIEYYHRKSRYTKEQHDRAVELLDERDEIFCVYQSYEYCEITVHTPYVSSKVVADFCEHFNYNIVKFSPLWEQESEMKCVDDHGSAFEIVLRYPHKSDFPIHLDAIFFESHIDDLDENDRQFDG